MTSYTGGCTCGAVRYEVTAEPVRSFQCQCRDCQRDTGAGHASVAVFPRAAMRVTGDVVENLRVADSGAETGKHQENPGLRRDRPGMAELAGGEQDQRERDQHDDGADQGRKIGVDALDADLGEDCGQRGENGGQDRPELPGPGRGQFRSSGSTGSGETSTPSSISARASSGEASP